MQEIDDLVMLEQLVLEYANNKSVADRYKKLADKLNTEIKSIMESRNLTDVTAGDYTVKYVVQNRETMDEDKLISIIDDAPGISQLRSTIIKTKEYVDFDALENAIYHGDIPQEVVQAMNRAREVRKIVTLRINKKKGE